MPNEGTVPQEWQPVGGEEPGLSRGQATHCSGAEQEVEHPHEVHRRSVAPRGQEKVGAGQGFLSSLCLSAILSVSHLEGLLATSPVPPATSPERWSHILTQGVP